MSDQAENEIGSRPALREELRFFLQILALTGFAVAQPVLDVFGKSPETFVFRGAGPLDVVLFAVAVTLVPAIGFWGLGIWTRILGPTVRRRAQWVILGMLIGLVGIQVLKRFTPLLDLRLLAAGLVIGAAAMLLVARSRLLRSYLGYAALAPLAFVGIFLLGSPSAKLLRAPDVSEAAAAATAAETPVVMVIFDEFPLLSLLDEQGKINEDMFPNFARLARAATWYRNYTTTDPSTKFAVPTMLTGKLADRNKEPLLVDYPDNLFTLLRETHRLLVSERMTELCPEEACLNPAEVDIDAGGEPDEAAPDAGREASLRLLLRDAAGIWRDLSLPGEITRDITGQFADDAGDRYQAIPEGDTQVGRGERRRVDTDMRVHQFTRFLRAVGEHEGKPGLHFAHVMLPHSPWRLFPSGAVYVLRRLEKEEERPATKDAPERRREEEWLAQLTRQRHLLQTQFVDRLVGDLIRRLEETGIYDETLLVLTADHGLSTHRGRGLRRAEEANLHEILWVPMFIKAPGQREGTVDDSNLMAIDLLPTMAELLGVELPFDVDGLAASDPRVQERDTRLITGGHYLAGEDLSFELTVISAEQVEAARRRVAQEVFRPADPSADVSLWPYLVGPGASLIGETVSELELGAPAGRSVRLERPTPKDVSSVDMESGRIPAYVSGSLVGVDGPEDSRVAVALNGRIGGVSEVFSRGGDHGLFAVVIPEFLFRPGWNELGFFLVEGSVLRPLATDPLTYRVVSDASGRTVGIEVSDGRTLSLRDEGIRGVLDRIGRTDRIVSVIGWAADVARQQTPEAFLVVYRGQVVHVANTTARPDVARHHASDALTDSGLRAHISAPLVADENAMEIYAVFDDAVFLVPRGPHSYAEPES